MPSNTIAGTAGFKGSDYADSPENRMVRLRVYEPALVFSANGGVSPRFTTLGFSGGR